MYRHLDAQRRLLFTAYRRYLIADRALETARSAALSWFPEPSMRSAMLIGDPGSRIRRLYERRERALARLMIARKALEDRQRRGRERYDGMVYLIEVF